MERRENFFSWSRQEKNIYGEKMNCGDVLGKIALKLYFVAVFSVVASLFA